MGQGTWMCVVETFVIFSIPLFREYYVVLLHKLPSFQRVIIFPDIGEPQKVSVRHNPRAAFSNRAVQGLAVRPVHDVLRRSHRRNLFPANCVLYR